jgi:Flp pilus assembly protein TadD
VAEAVSLVEPLLRDFPGHPDVVPIAVEARLGQGDVEAAEALVAPVVTAHPRDIRLLAAEAHVEMARQAWAPALAILDRALAIEPEAPTLHADRGRVALGLGDAAEARSAFDRALALSPALPEALVGRLELDIAEHRLADGQAILDRIDESELTSLRVERLRGPCCCAGSPGRRASARCAPR